MAGKLTCASFVPQKFQHKISKNTATSGQVSYGRKGTPAQRSTSVKQGDQTEHSKQFSKFHKQPPTSSRCQNYYSEDAIDTLQEQSVFNTKDKAVFEQKLSNAKKVIDKLCEDPSEDWGLHMPSFNKAIHVLKNLRCKENESSLVTEWKTRVAREKLGVSITAVFDRIVKEYTERSGEDLLTLSCNFLNEICCYTFLLPETSSSLKGIELLYKKHINLALEYLKLLLRVRRPILVKHTCSSLALALDRNGPFIKDICQDREYIASLHDARLLIRACNSQVEYPKTAQQLQICQWLDAGDLRSFEQYCQTPQASFAEKRLLVHEVVELTGHHKKILESQPLQNSSFYLSVLHTLLVINDQTPLTIKSSAILSLRIKKFFSNEVIYCIFTLASSPDVHTNSLLLEVIDRGKEQGFINETASILIEHFFNSKSEKFDEELKISSEVYSCICQFNETFNKQQFETTMNLLTRILQRSQSLSIEIYQQSLIPLVLSCIDKVQRRTFDKINNCALGVSFSGEHNEPRMAKALIHFQPLILMLDKYSEMRPQSVLETWNWFKTLSLTDDLVQLSESEETIDPCQLCTCIQRLIHYCPKLGGKLAEKTILLLLKQFFTDETLEYSEANKPYIDTLIIITLQAVKPYTLTDRHFNEGKKDFLKKEIEKFCVKRSIKISALTEKPFKETQRNLSLQRQSLTQYLSSPPAINSSQLRQKIDQIKISLQDPENEGLARSLLILIQHLEEINWCFGGFYKAEFDAALNSVMKTTVFRLICQLSSHNLTKTGFQILDSQNLKVTVIKYTPIVLLVPEDYDAKFKGLAKKWQEEVCKLWHQNFQMLCQSPCDPAQINEVFQFYQLRLKIQNQSTNDVFYNWLTKLAVCFQKETEGVEFEKLAFVNDWCEELKKEFESSTRRKGQIKGNHRKLLDFLESYKQLYYKRQESLDANLKIDLVKKSNESPDDLYFSAEEGSPDESDESSDDYISAKSSLTSLEDIDHDDIIRAQCIETTDESINEFNHVEEQSDSEVNTNVQEEKQRPITVSESGGTIEAPQESELTNVNQVNNALIEVENEQINLSDFNTSTTDLDAHVSQTQENSIENNEPVVLSESKEEYTDHDNVTIKEETPTEWPLATPSPITPISESSFNTAAVSLKTKNAPLHQQTNSITESTLGIKTVPVNTSQQPQPRGIKQRFVHQRELQPKAPIQTRLFIPTAPIQAKLFIPPQQRTIIRISNPLLDPIVTPRDEWYLREKQFRNNIPEKNQLLVELLSKADFKTKALYDQLCEFTQVESSTDRFYEIKRMLLSICLDIQMLGKISCAGQNGYNDTGLSRIELYEMVMNLLIQNSTSFIEHINDVVSLQIRNSQFVQSHLLMFFGLRLRWCASLSSHYVIMLR
ncbi:hypothetical protein D5018_20365 [Parashewanella curva]|uniref:Uncharacterized protein n=1 Tax=Parashewanella curva TaxID=2338552 RepID=A0A3L8PTW3_9GAMM|nr:hypothetical protein [Parashewanella curva]RLV57848.1 hypothetical protein D5018_20365 [Parashewanella curva]